MARSSSTLLPFRREAFGDAVGELERWRAALDAKAPLIRSWEGQLRRDLQAEAVAASTAMEGVPVTVDEVRRILAGERPTSVTSEDRELVIGYREAMSYALRRADDAIFEWSPELIKAVHDRVLAGRFASGAGRYGKGRFIVDDATGQVVYTPPPVEDVDSLVRRACRQMNASRIHPALGAAWVHVAIAAIHPFQDGNGRTARVLASLAMYRGGFKRPEFCSLEEWWGRHRREYYAAFRGLGPSFDPARDVTPFVRAHLGAQLSQVRALDLRERTTRRIWVALARVCDAVGLPARAAMILWEVFNGRAASAPYYMAVADVSRASITADLRALRGAGLIASVGRTRGRTYVAGPRLYQLVASEVGAAVDADRAGASAERAIEPTREAIIAELARRLSVLRPARTARSSSAEPTTARGRTTRGR